MNLQIAFYKGKMAPLKRSIVKDDISKSRAAKASLLTGMSVLTFLLWGFHLYWAVGALYSNRFGGVFSNLVIIVGGLAVDFFVSIKVLLYAETHLLSDGIDADHKKYL